MAKDNYPILDLLTLLIDSVASLKRGPSKHLKLSINAEVRFVNGKWVLSSMKKWTNRVPMDSEMLGGPMETGDWDRIFQMRELSAQRRKESSDRQELFELLKQIQKNPDKDQHLSRPIQSLFNGWCCDANFPYRLVRHATHRKLSSRGKPYVGKLF